MYTQAETTTEVGQSKAPSGSPRKPSLIEQFMPFVFLLVIIYFLFIRPNQKRIKSHQEFTKNLKKGDEVLTSGGVLGKIDGLTEKYVILEIAEKVRIRVLRQNISSFSQNKKQPTQMNRNVN